jgi:hypothetical protein
MPIDHYNFVEEVLRRARPEYAHLPSASLGMTIRRSEDMKRPWWGREERSFGAREGSFGAPDSNTRASG